MKTNNVRNFYIIAILVTIIVFRVMQSNAEEKIDLSLTTVKKKQNEYIEEAKLPLRTGEVNARKLEYIDNAQSLGLARADVSEFFDKTIPLDKPKAFDDDATTSLRSFLRPLSCAPNLIHNECE